MSAQPERRTAAFQAVYDAVESGSKPRTRPPWPACLNVLSDGPPISGESVRALIEQSALGATEAVEGAVWRVESRGEFDFIAKWVRAEKEDGKYLAEKFGGVTLWNVRAGA